MDSLRNNFVSRAVAAVVLAVASSGAMAETQVVQQVLDRVTVFNRGTAMDMKFNDPEDRPPDFFNFNLVESTGLSSCQLNGSRGLYCIDGRQVKRWQDPADGGAGQREFLCTNGALRLDAKRTDTCNALAVSLNGTIWLAGRRNSAYALIKLVEKVYTTDPDDPGTCPEGLTLQDEPDPGDPTKLVPSRYCYVDYAQGRPLLLKLVVVEGEEAKYFDLGAGAPVDGVLGLDIRNAVTYFDPDPLVQPVDIIEGKSAWGLGGNEKLIDLALLQATNDADSDGISNYLLVTTGTGRVIAHQTDDGAVSPVTREVFNAPFERNEATAPLPKPAVACSSVEQRFGIAASSKTERVYVTDRNFCHVIALRPADPPATDPPTVPTPRVGLARGLVNVPDTDGRNLTLSTSFVTSDPSVPISDKGTYPPDGAAVAPGITVNLAECEANGTCTLIPNGNTQSGKPWVELVNVELNRSGSTGTGASRMVLFQVKNIPDCRYDPGNEACVGTGAVLTPPGASARPGYQYLDVTKLLPTEVTEQFTAVGALPPGLPPLLISPQFRGRRDRGYTFDALFGIPEDGVVFKDVFEGVFDIAGLIGADSERCERNGATGTAALAQWDVVTYVSERYVAVGGLGSLTDQGNPYRFVDTLTNIGCGSTKSGIVNWSMIPYGLEPAYGPETGIAYQEEFFVDLLIKLYDDLEQTQNELACRIGIDGTASNPLGGYDSTTCTSLRAGLVDVRIKLDKCIAATRDPKTSASNENCQSFKSQFLGYKSALDSIPAASPTADPANRIGSLKARAMTILHVYDERFLPSIPRGGFVGP